MVNKKLSLAFIWHMHQPVYQESKNDYFLIPWVRLHAVKDYYSMLMHMNDFGKLRLNFSLVPILLTALEAYGNRGLHDLHSKLTVTPVEELNDEDKLFIINNFFDANYSNMILPYIKYADLYKKRYSSDEIGINDFSDEEYSDIMAWFNLVWFDKKTKREHPQIKCLLEKEGHFTLEDRINIIKVQRDIISKIIPAYKEYQDNNKIEILASPYFHPIMPVLLEKKYTGQDLKEDAVNQVQRCIEKYNKLFGKVPKGVWPPEQCISPKTLELFADMGFEWTVTDEGILAKTIHKEFERDFKGYLQDPYDITSVYSYTGKNKKPISLVFREAVMPNLINFEYSQHNPVDAANDLYDRIKTVQAKLEQSPDKNNLLTIALDGENCWECYSDDGESFINTLYSLIEGDKTLETVLLSDYMKAVKNKKELKTVHTGSWINRNLKLWIDEPTKNLAWQYVVSTRQDLIKFAKECDSRETIDAAWEELYIAEGSDWFWWFGEPNDSGQDEIFDYLFRVHLVNVYNIFKKPVPEYLNIPLIVYMGKPLRNPKSNISPNLDGRNGEADNWQNAGCIEIPDGPILQSNKPFDRIYFGCDEKNLYLRFDFNKIYLESKRGASEAYLKNFQTFIYLKNERLAHSNCANVRTITKQEAPYPTLMDKYTHEVLLSAVQEHSPVVVSKANSAGLWALKLSNKVQYEFLDILEVAIPFDDMDIRHGENLEFFIVNATMGVANDIFPKDILLSVVRP